MTTPTPRGDVLGGVGLAGHVAALAARPGGSSRGRRTRRSRSPRRRRRRPRPGLAALEDLPGGQLEPSPPHEVGGPDQDRGPVAPGRRRPWAGVPAAATAAVGVLGAGHRVRHDRDVRAARVERIDGRAPVPTSGPSISRGYVWPSRVRTSVEASAMACGSLARRSRTTGSLRKRPGSLARRRRGRWGDGRAAWLRPPRGSAQDVDRPALGEARLEERLVRRVLEQPADQVRHPRHRSPTGTSTRVRTPRSLTAPCRGSAMPCSTCTSTASSGRPSTAAPRTTPTRYCARCDLRTPDAHRPRWPRAWTRTPRMTRGSRPCSATPVTSNPALAPGSSRCPSTHP